MPKIANNIRTLRFANNEMNQQQLTDLLGVTRRTIKAVENIKYSPSSEVAFKISEVFSENISEVFSYGIHLR